MTASSNGRARTLAVLLAVCAAWMWPLDARSQGSFPDKPIRLIVPQAPGSATDLLARSISAEIETILNQKVIIENKPGAAFTIGLDIVAKAAPDGYTIVTVIAGIAPLILTVNNNFPAKDVKALIAYAKANPGRVNFGSSGIGAAAHLTTELLKQTAGIDMVHVPFKGTAPALTALISGDIQMLVDVPSSLMPHARGGKIRALAMFSAKRIPGAPEVPTVAEAGGPPLEASTWVLFLAPAGTPRDIVNRLSAETRKAINESDIRSRFEQIGIEAVGNSPEEAAKFLQDEVAKWAKVITAAGVKAEQ